jgi:hypothetical protein
MSPSPSWRHQGLTGELYAQPARIPERQTLPGLHIAHGHPAHAPGRSRARRRHRHHRPARRPGICDKGSSVPGRPGSAGRGGGGSLPLLVGPDIRLKMRVYEERGVREYWVVDPGNKTMTVYKRDDSGRFGKATAIVLADTPRAADFSAALPEFVLDWRPFRRRGNRIEPSHGRARRIRKTPWAPISWRPSFPTTTRPPPAGPDLRQHGAGGLGLHHRPGHSREGGGQLPALVPRPSAFSRLHGSRAQCGAGPDPEAAGALGGRFRGRTPHGADRRPGGRRHRPPPPGLGPVSPLLRLPDSGDPCKHMAAAYLYLARKSTRNPSASFSCAAWISGRNSPWATATPSSAGRPRSPRQGCPHP